MRHWSVQPFRLCFEGEAVIALIEISGPSLFTLPYRRGEIRLFGLLIRTKYT